MPCLEAAAISITEILGPGGRSARVPDSRAFLTSKACRRREYFGGAHLPVFGLSFGMNGFSMLATGTLLRDEDAELGFSLLFGAGFTRAELGRAVTPSSRIRNRLMACRADIGSEVGRSTSKIKGET